MKLSLSLEADLDLKRVRIALDALDPVCFQLHESFDLSFRTFQKPKSSEKASELLGFWLLGAVWLLESPKASSPKVAKSSNK